MRAVITIDLDGVGDASGVARTLRLLADTVDDQHAVEPTALRDINGNAVCILELKSLPACVCARCGRAH